MKSRITIFLLCLIVTGCSLPDPIPETPHRMQRVPQFDDFLTKRIYKNKPRPVNLLSHPRAVRFEDQLVAGAKTGPNFAGHQTVIRWSCGDECQQFAVVDAMTGSVVFAPFVTHLGAKFRLDSNLFVVNPPEAVDRAACEGKPRSYYRTVYYVWHFGTFVEVYSVGYE